MVSIVVRHDLIFCPTPEAKLQIGTSAAQFYLGVVEYRDRTRTRGRTRSGERHICVCVRARNVVKDLATTKLGFLWIDLNSFATVLILYNIDFHASLGNHPSRRDSRGLALL